MMMVHRMIGVKPGLAHKAEANPIAGPGGCPMAGQSGQQQVSGVSYLRATVAGSVSLRTWSTSYLRTFVLG